MLDLIYYFQSPRMVGFIDVISLWKKLKVREVREFAQNLTGCKWESRGSEVDFPLEVSGGLWLPR